jgi:hypothetical protein
VPTSASRHAPGSREDVVGDLACGDGVERRVVGSHAAIMDIRFTPRHVVSLSFAAGGTGLRASTSEQCSLERATRWSASSSPPGRGYPLRAGPSGTPRSLGARGLTDAFWGDGRSSYVLAVRSVAQEGDPASVDLLPNLPAEDRHRDLLPALDEDHRSERKKRRPVIFGGFPHRGKAGPVPADFPEPCRVQ